MSLSGIFDPIVIAYFNGKSGGSACNQMVAFAWLSEQDFSQFPEVDTGTNKIVRLADYKTIDELEGSIIQIAGFIYKVSVESESLANTELADGVYVPTIIWSDGSQACISLSEEASVLIGIPSGLYFDKTLLSSSVVGAIIIGNVSWL